MKQTLDSIRAHCASLPRWFTLSTWTLLLLLTVSLALRIGRAEHLQSRLSKDLAIIHDIGEGLLNVDSWKTAILDILSTKLETLELPEGDRAQAKQKIEALLYTLVEDLERSYHRDRADKIMGIVESMASDMLGVFDQMRKEIPDMAESILAFLEEPENRENLREYLSNALDKASDETFGSTNHTKPDAVFARWNIPESDRSTRTVVCSTALNNLYDASLETERPFLIAWGILFLITALALMVATPTHLEIKLATATLCSWMMAGICMPLLIIEAKIDVLQFQLLGSPLRFEDQILFHQSKSILEVVQLLLTESRGFATVLAGICIMLFSMVIPAAKMVAAFFWRPTLSRSIGRIKRLLLFKSSKWAMADVFVAAIFISHLGFKGMLKDQMQRLESATQNVDLMTTANSNLLPGFMAFTGFAVLGILLSSRISQLSNAGKSEMDSI